MPATLPHRLFALALAASLAAHALGMAIDLLDSAQPGSFEPNFCNDTSLMLEAGLQKSPLGQFLGYPCSAEFYHCRWQSDGFRTYKKICKAGLVYDTLGTQNCNYDFSVKGCGMSNGADTCEATEFSCPLSESCVSMAQRCDGTYDCVLEEDEQNCPMCNAEEFPCLVSEQCIPIGSRCNGVAECADGTDEQHCQVCGPGNFHCLKSSQCIPAHQRCDGVPQCSHGEDELLCKVTHERFYVCENRLDQIPVAQVCDEIEQCPDGSDERYCKQGTVTHVPLPPAPQSAGAALLGLVSSRPLPLPEFEERQIVSEQDGQEIGVDAEEEVEEEEDLPEQPLPAHPLLPLAQFNFLTTPPPTPKPTRPPTSTRRPPTTPKKVRTTTPTHKFSFAQAGKSVVARPTPAPVVSMVSVTAPSVRVSARTYPTLKPSTRGVPRVVDSITVTAAPLPETPEHSDDVDAELLQKLGARFSNKGNFDARDLLSKLETLLSSADGAETAPASSPSLGSVGHGVSGPYAPAGADTHAAEPAFQASNPSAVVSSPAFAPTRFATQTKTLVAGRSVPGTGRLTALSRLRVTGRPSSRKWRPSLSNNPSQRTTPVPRNTAPINVQFRQSDATKPAPVPLHKLRPAAPAPVVEAKEKKEEAGGDEAYFTYDEPAAPEQQS